MTCKFNVPGKKRKALAQCIAEWLGCSVNYKGAPTFAYEVDYFTIDKDGVLSFDDRADSEVIERLFEHLYDEGFECENREEPTGLTINIPFDKVNCGNLMKVLEAKGNLIKKALGVEDIRIEMNEDSVGFPWFNNLPSPEETKAYSDFICKLCEFSRSAKRVTVTEKEVGNEKYAFRCFLLRLGFIGEEYKQSRKILLKNLSGSSAFKSGRKYAPGLEPIPTPENTVSFDGEEAKRRLRDPSVQAEIKAIINGEDGAEQ